MLQEFCFNFDKKYNHRILSVIKMSNAVAGNLMLTAFMALQSPQIINFAQRP